MTEVEGQLWGPPVMKIHKFIERSSSVSFLYCFNFIYRLLDSGIVLYLIYIYFLLFQMPNYSSVSSHAPESEDFVLGRQ